MPDDLIECHGCGRVIEPFEDCRCLDRPSDPDRACPHENFEAIVGINRELASDDDPTMVAITAEVTASCADCGEHIVWHCPDFGLLRNRPAVGVDGREIRLPGRMANHPADWGLQLPGFSIHHRSIGGPDV